ncbi:hypothetical protein [Luteibacter sp. SG786]|uniref:hypothetical protein n=1 Tax=Luteibacter sp. SG786 TaxID=2587130 RepID=UPI0014204BFB|nr:hypothetical protein [Luteibacter sp. SG786]NII54649.1 hypothetical protein [Luteibacter sp. SG786]
MHITPARLSHIGTASAQVALSQPPRKNEALQIERPPSVARVDFSRITPRQLQAYCDELIFTGGDAEFEDASALFTSLPSGIFESDPDKPIDLAGHIEGMIEFDRNNGFDALAVFYAGLLERMKLMEAKSVHLSVVA